MNTDRASQQPDLGEEAVQDIVDLVVGLGPAADRAQIAAAVIELVPAAKWRQVLAKKLIPRPELLTGAGAEGAPVVIKLIEKLRTLGVAGIVAPACPFCDRVLVLSRGRDGLRCCKTCWDAAHTKSCPRCGTVTTLQRRTAAGESLCWSCAEAEPELQETCGGCGRITLAWRRDGDVVFCKSCCRPPTATCSICGRIKPCLQADTDAPRCKHCSDKLRAQPCIECGQLRVVSRRTTAGEPLCKDCGSTDICTGCCRRMPIRSRTMTAALCQSCYKNDPSSHSTCLRCGTTGTLWRVGRCANCSWPDAVRAMLTSTDGTLRPDLEPVLTALEAVDPATGLYWAARASNETMLRRLAGSTGPVTHGVIDKLTPTSGVEHLRTMLIHHGALPVRDERLISAERSVERRIDRVEDPDDRKILASFATWHHLRRLRSLAERRPLTQEQVTYSVNALTAAANLLNWLRAHGSSLATCNQADIDEWLADHDAFSRTCGFVTWAVKGGHAHDIDVPRAKNELVREVFTDHDQRWVLARWLLTDNSIGLPERVAGLLVLLYAQRVARISRLTTGHVAVTADSVEIYLSGQPITVPPEFGDLIRDLIAERTGNGPADSSHDNAWLFPGPRRGQPRSSRELLRALAKLGVPATIGRNTALMELAGEMPAAVISGLLGLNLQRATTWTQDAGNTRPGYAAEVPRRAKRTTSRACDIQASHQQLAQQPRIPD